MNYSELVEQTKKELEKSYGTSAALTQLYNNAKANYEKQHKESVESLNKDYEEKKNQAAAQKLTNEKNTGEFLASRGLSFSGESAYDFTKISNNLHISGYPRKILHI